MSLKSINKAIEVLNQGGTVVFPTDTVYGFLADAGNKKAINKIFKIKKRPKTKPLAVFVKDLKMAKELAKVSAEQEKIIKKRWPGPYTFLLPSLRGASATKQSKKYIIKNNKIALRVPKHKFLLILLKKINKPLAQTSVNISGQPEMNKIKDIEKIQGIDLIVDAGTLPKRKPSQVFDLTGDILTRIR